MVRARPRDDKAYAPSDYSALMELYRSNPTPIVEFLLGTRAAIVMPSLDRHDKDRFEQHKDWALKLTGALPVRAKREEFEFYLTEAQSAELDQGLPVLLHMGAERLRRNKPSRGRQNNSPTLNRINDARQYMVALSLLHLGHLWGKDPTAVSSESAFSAVVYDIIERLWPKEVKKKGDDDACYEYLKTAFDAGQHISVCSRFQSTSTGVSEQVHEHHLHHRYAGQERLEEIRYWWTTFRAALAIDGYAELQQSAFIEMCKTPEGQEFNRESVIAYNGGKGYMPDVDCILPVALYDVEDLGNVMRRTGMMYNYYRCAAIVGEISRGQTARVSMLQAELLYSALETVSAVARQECMDVSEFLCYSMRR